MRKTCQLQNKSIQLLTNQEHRPILHPVTICYDKKKEKFQKHP